MNADSTRQHQFSLYAALLVAWVAMLGSLYFSEVRHFVPCTLCWYQRILMYPLALLIGVGLLRQDRHLAFLVLPFSLIGQGVSTYHYLLQKTTIFGAPTACSMGVPCSTAYINWLGFITIPFLAMVAFMLITLFCVVAIYRGELDVEVGRIPWQPVTIIVGTVLIAYIVLAQTAGNATAQTTSALPLALTPIALTPAAFSPVEPTADAETLAEGKQLYAQACSGCHGADAQGVANLAPGLVASDFVQGAEHAEILAMVRQGRMPGDAHTTTGMVMPASGGRPDLSDAQLLAVIDYLRAISVEVH